MSFEGKSDQDIIAEQAASLDAKSRNPSLFQSRVDNTESGVTDGENLNEFQGVQVTTGRTGQTGGGENPQLIPPEEGGEGTAGTMSNIYDDPRGGKSDIQADIARNDPSVNRTNAQREGGVAGARPPQELEDQ
ncbi:MAG: hypothetical protein CYPHOPRED_000083 [Cyphobasidiales sp. Tagirdzhanova-0007]|nr:MAG: hypothetical protein CYPHOPRED_000083 [Cyphobasidiales sp. Tagirdzhanova-0007]